MPEAATQRSAPKPTPPIVIGDEIQRSKMALFLTLVRSDKRPKPAGSAVHSLVSKVYFCATAKNSPIRKVIGRLNKKGKALPTAKPVLIVLGK